MLAEGVVMARRDAQVASFGAGALHHHEVAPVGDELVDQFAELQPAGAGLVEQFQGPFGIAGQDGVGK